MSQPNKGKGKEKAVEQSEQKEEQSCECAEPIISIVAVCSTRAGYVRDEHMLHDFLLLMTTYADQSNIHRQRWLTTLDLVSEHERLNGFVVGKPDDPEYPRVHIPLSFVTQNISEGNLMRIKEDEIVNKTLALFHEECVNMSQHNGHVLLLVLGHAVHDGNPLRADILLSTDSDGDNYWISKFDMEEIIEATGAKATVVAVTCEGARFASTKYNLVAASNLKKHSSFERSNSGFSRGSMFGSVLDDTLRNEFEGEHRLCYLTAEGLRKEITAGLKEIEKDPIVDTSFLMKLSEKEIQSGSKGVSIPPRPAQPPWEHLPELPRPAAAAPAQAKLGLTAPNRLTSGIPCSERRLGELISYYLKSKRDRSRTHTMIEYSIWRYRRGELKQPDKENLVDYLRYYKYWNGRINSVKNRFCVAEASKYIEHSFCVAELSDESIEQSVKGLNLGEIRELVKEYKEVKDFLPWNPVHHEFDWGWDDRQLYYIRVFLMNVGVEKVKEWLVKTNRIYRGFTTEPKLRERC
ncbi:hypothetical protein BJ508DRAFT_343242 [Ascobolus immersus RN42]|uniref:Uncharacterized protein n=1 Tax=Ascobolus immersus RN42 TaxID=1160509 RepID=A0A3N4IAY7_ASCIM|nr:hypothetical protein BJ508DRAFT_343242 [Ascobolus immersus RN42]